MQQTSSANCPEQVSGTEELSVYEYYLIWFPARTAELSDSAVVDYQVAFRNFILPLLGGKKLSQVKPIDVDNLLKNLSGYSESYRTKILGALRRMMDSAIENDLIIKNPCLKKKAGGKKAKPKIPLTEEQQKVLLDAVKGTRAEPFVMLGLFAGLRREEILGLRWECIHLDVPYPYLEVRYTLTFDQSGRGIHSDHLKSKAARRDIPMPRILADQLAELRKLSGAGEEALLFPDRDGKLMSKTAADNLWSLVTRRKIQKDRGGRILEDPRGNHPWCQRTIDFNVTPHLLRHTYITALCGSGMDIKKIQYLAGHSRVSLTLDIYTKVTQNKPQELWPRVNNVFPDYGKGPAVPIKIHKLSAKRGRRGNLIFPRPPLKLPRRRRKTTR